jgi:hypothetical protein
MVPEAPSSCHILKVAGENIVVVWAMILLIMIPEASIMGVCSEQLLHNSIKYDL